MCLAKVSQEIKEHEFKQFNTNISHDIRTPLAVMKGYLQLLRKAGIYGSSKEYLEICISHTNEMEKRVQQFFEYSYWSGMEEDVELQRINITNLVKDGCGIDASKVFNLFYVGNEERNHSTGLGLSIVKLLAERMGGEVFAQMDGGMFYIGFTLLSAK